MNRLANGLKERIPIDPETWLKALREELPIHLKSWLFFLGGTPLILFCILAATGILLTFGYVPYPAQAFHSVENITYKVRMGWLIRGIHQAASQLMILSVMLHMIRVFVTRAYRKPRELSWVLGMSLFMLVLTFAFTGYSLVYDQLSYWATTIGTNMIAALPLIGKPMLYLLRGGEAVNPNTLTRFYNFHIGVLPTLMVLLVGAHLVLVRLLGVSHLENDPRTETYSFFPDHAMREAIIGLLLLIGLVSYVVHFPPSVGSPATPDVTPGHIRPEWYFFPTYRWLQITSLGVGILGTMIAVLAMFAWPFIDAELGKRSHGKTLGMVIGTGFFLLTLGFLVWESFIG